MFSLKAKAQTFDDEVKDDDEKDLELASEQVEASSSSPLLSEPLSSGPLTVLSDHEDSQIVEIPDFVPAWQGLRGLAVSMTCLAHIQTVGGTFSDLCGRGGITFFFVLSGFLITGVLHKLERAHKDASLCDTQRKSSLQSYRHLGRFFADRMVRLYPALVCLVLSTSIAHYFMWGQLPPRFGAQAAIALTYLVDIIRSPLTLWDNTWSLGVEEQYYIVWALVLPGLLKLSKRMRNLIVGSVLCISLFFSYNKYTRILPIPDYLCAWWSLTNSIWSMLLGSLARLNHLPSWMKNKRTANAGLILYISMLVLTSPISPLPGVQNRFFNMAVLVEPLSALSAFLVVVGSINGNALLESSIFFFLGRVSYSFYLYQVPLLILQGWPKGLGGLGITALALVAAMLSTLYLEEPIRQYYRKRFWIRR